MNTVLNDLHKFLSGTRESVVLIREGSRGSRAGSQELDSIFNYSGFVIPHGGLHFSAPFLLLLDAPNFEPFQKQLPMRASSRFDKKSKG